MNAVKGTIDNPGSRAGTARLRETWLKWLKPTHHWAGVSLGLFIIVSAITGAAMAFRPQVDPLLYPSMLTASACSQPITVDQVLANAVVHHPQSSVSYVRVQNRPGQPWIVRFKDRDAVHVDPCTGRVLGTQNRYGGVYGIIELVHTAKYVPNGNILIGSITLLFAILLIVGGFTLWWPRGSNGFRHALKFNPRTKGRTRLMSLHRIAGAYAAAALLILAVTALPQAFDWAKDAIYVTTQSTPPTIPAATPLTVGGPRISLESVWQTAVRLSPNPVEQLIHVDHAPGKAFETFMIEADAPHIHARSFLYIDPVDGKIVSFEPYRSSNIGRKIYYWTMALHMGVFGGVAGQLVMLLIAAVILLIVTTGATTFLQRRANAKRNAAA
jgi:uncharacterized iron-regulated membrane protein